MKISFVLTILLLAVLRLSAQNVIAAEYFFDADPGAGQGTSLATGAPAPAVSFSATIPTATLNSGFHLLAIRTKNSDGHWGPFEQRTVYVSPLATNVGAIEAAEVFFDNDPGFGAGTALGVSTPGHVVTFSAVVPVTSLQSGFHTIAIRTKNTDGKWGFFDARGFYIHHLQVNVQNIEAAEYYIDTDPGPGNGININIGSSGNMVSFTALLPTTSLTSGFHTLAIRAKTANGIWGIVETKGFYIQPVSADMTQVTAAEYFLDADPGVGNGSPLVITNPGNAISQSFLITIPSGTPNGQHVLAIRVKDVAGNWGLFEVNEITVSAPLPLHWLSFTAQHKDKKNILYWNTADEVNTASFDVERSINGIDFTYIGRVSAKGQTVNLYEFPDADPHTGLNYYRLKQVDKDGKYNHSKIVAVYSGSSERGFRIYPQPVVSELTIDFPGNGREVFIQVYDASGHLVLNERQANSAPLHLSTEKLPKGMYWISVSDGIIQQKGRFIKQ